MRANARRTAVEVEGAVMAYCYLLLQRQSLIFPPRAFAELDDAGAAVGMVTFYD